MKSALFLFFSWAAALSAQAHGFEERYDLPVPLAYVIVGACTMVLLTFVVALVFVRRPAAGFVAPNTSILPDEPIPPGAPVPFGLSLSKPAPLHPMFWLLKGLAFLLFALTLIAALYGTSDPLMNLAPTLVWIGWWIGLSFVVVLLGNVWPVLDPWRSTFEALDFFARRLGATKGIARRWPWPAAIGMWPATVFLLVWCALEVIYPIASSPLKLGYLALTWSAINLAGMVGFGREAWQDRADVFALYFAALGRTWRTWRVRPDAAASGPIAGQVGFVLAMLATVLFDGLHGSAAWPVFESLLKAWIPQALDLNGYIAGGLGLLMVWLAFVLAYGLTCCLCAALMRSAHNRPTPYTGAQLAAHLAPTLIPIAAAYLIAHNFSNLLIQGQNLIALLSDPLGRQWDVFGTAKFYPDISVVDAKLTWLVAVTAIVAGHVLSIWQAHRVALTWGLPTRRTALTTLPLTILMVAYTAISLMVIAAPMVNDVP